MPQIKVLHTLRARDLAADLVCDLQHDGYSVPWNPNASLTTAFDDAERGDCAIVLWTIDAATSRWVWNAAVHAHEHDALVEVLLEPVESPFGGADAPIDFKPCNP